MCRKWYSEAIKIYQEQGFEHDKLIMKREIKEDKVDEKIYEYTLEELYKRRSISK